LKLVAEPNSFNRPSSTLQMLELLILR
jgi:hypothetical protein